MSAIPEPFKKGGEFLPIKVFADIRGNGLHGLWMALWR